MEQECNIEMTFNKKTRQAERLCIHFWSSKHIEWAFKIKWNRFLRKATKSSAKSTGSSKNGKRRPSPVINTHPENQAVFSSPAIVPGTKSFGETVRTQRDKKNTLFVIDKISKGIHFKELNGFSSNGNAKMVNIPGAISKKILHYLNIHFSNSSTDTVVVHVDVNDTIWTSTT